MGRPLACSSRPRSARRWRSRSRGRARTPRRADAPSAEARRPTADGRQAGRGRSRPPRRRPACGSAKLQFRGNRKVEDDAIRVNLKTAPGVTLTPGEAARGHPRDLEDGLLRGRPGRGRARSRAAASSDLRRSRRSRSIRKIYVAGNDEVGADEDQRGPRPQEGADPRPREGQEERREDQGPLRREGLLPRRGRLRDQARHRGRGRRLVPRRRARQGRGAAGQLRRQPAPSPTTSCATSIGTQRGRACCRS